MAMGRVSLAAMRVSGIPRLAVRDLRGNALFNSFFPRRFPDGFQMESPDLLVPDRDRVL
jgi:hypothetical protein